MNILFIEEEITEPMDLEELYARTDSNGMRHIESELNKVLLSTTIDNKFTYVFDLLDVNELNQLFKKLKAEVNYD